jgi:transposase
MKKAVYVRLRDEDRKTLEQKTRGGEIKARVYKRARILLAADRTQDDWSGQAAIVKATGASTATVSATCRRYADEGLNAALSEKARPGAAPKVTGEVEAKLVMLACSEPPGQHVSWTLTLLRDELIKLEVVESLSTTAVGNALKKMNLSLGGSRNGASRKRRRGL